MKLSSALKLAAPAAFVIWLSVPSHVVSQGTTSDTYRNLALFGEVLERVRADYVEPVTDQQLIEEAINGMLTALDPHSSFLTARAFRDMQTQNRGEFGGLGIEVTMENGVVKVVSPIDDTPAARAGVRPNDLIFMIDGESVQGMTLQDAVERMRGPVNSQIRLMIRRGNQEPFELILTRAVVRVQSVRTRVEGEFGIIRISSFTEQTEAGLRSGIERVRQELGPRLRGFVLDLRNNPGGLLDQAIAVSDAFLERGEIVSTRGRRAEEAQRYNARAGDLTNGLPVVVLINGGSASASEIVAGALQDHRRAILLGTRSFGKGSVQTIMPIGNQGAIRLTTARYYTPSGRSIQAQGIDPDIVVEPARIERIDVPTQRREADLRGALRNDNPGQQPAPAPTTPSAPPPQAQTPPATPPATPTAAAPEDYQMLRALDLLRGLALYNQRVQQN